MLELVVAARQIGRVPRGHPVVLKRGVEPIRRKVFGNYLIFYRIEQNRIDVVRILHGARDYEKLFNRGGS